MAARFCYHWPARGIYSREIFFTDCDRAAAASNKKRIFDCFETSARDHMNLLNGFVKQPRHISEQCALLYVSRGVVVSIEVLTLTIDSRCVDENSDFLSMEKHVMFEVAE